MANVPRSRKRTLQLRLLLVAFALLFALIAAEIALQFVPGLLPVSFRERYPPHGIELFHPGLLDRTPIEHVPLPYGVDPYDGPPPSDLVMLGIAPREAEDRDREHTKRLVIPADKNGLPNKEETTKSDIVLVGDSFTLYAGQQEPPGLQSALEAASSETIYNLGISGLGPIREKFLLEHLGLPSKPRLVLWFYFGGNDAINALHLVMMKAQGNDTYGQLFATRRAPSVLLPSLIGGWFTPPRDERLIKSPLPPLRTRGENGFDLWLYPDVLRMVSVPRGMIAGNEGWKRAVAAMQAAEKATSDAGAEFVLVYLPCKAQIYLPLLTDDPELLYRYVTSSLMTVIPIADEPKKFARDVLARRNLIETMLEAKCKELGIRFWSATPAMDAAAKAGEQLYYTTDTHWRAAGQLVTARALIPYLRGEGLLP